MCESIKYLVLDYQFVREQVQGDNIRVSHIISAYQLVDAFINPLLCTRFNDLAVKNGLSSYCPS